MNDANALSTTVAFTVERWISGGLPEQGLGVDKSGKARKFCKNTKILFYYRFNSFPDNDTF